MQFTNSIYFEHIIIPSFGEKLRVLFVYLLKMSIKLCGLLKMSTINNDAQTVQFIISRFHSFLTLIYLTN